MDHQVQDHRNVTASRLSLGLSPPAHGGRAMNAYRGQGISSNARQRRVEQPHMPDLRFDSVFPAQWQIAGPASTAEACQRFLDNRCFALPGILPGTPLPKVSDGAGRDDVYIHCLSSRASSSSPAPPDPNCSSTWRQPIIGVVEPFQFRFLLPAEYISDYLSMRPGT